MSGNVFRFSVKNNSETLVDMNAVEEVVSLSKNAAELGKQLEAELATHNADTAQDSLKKFIRSQIEATASDGQTRHVHVMDADALADLVIAKGLEHVEVKCESHIGKDNWELCKDLGVLYINSDQPNFETLREQAIAHGVKKVESTLSKAVHCEELTEFMRVESQITGNPAAVFAQDSLKKFIRSQIEATASDGQTRHVHVMDADALADLVIAKGLEYVEVKCESHIGKDNWELCKDLGVLYLNSDQPNFEALKEQAIAHGVKKVGSTLSKAVHCEELTELMRVESQITGNPAAVFFPHAYDKAQAIKLVELNGAISAKAWAKVGGAVAIGSNVVDVLTGDKTVKEAAKDIAISAAQEVLIDYAKSQIIATAVTQPVVQSAIKKYGGDAVMKAVGQTSLGATAVSATSNVLLSSTGLVAAAIKGVGTTTAGLVSTVGFTSTAGAITAGTAAITGGLVTAAAFAAPIVAPAAVAYGAYKLLKKIF